MILPTKGIHPSKALLTVGGLIIDELDEAKTVSRVWTTIRARYADDPHGGITFDWFVLAVTLVYSLGKLEQGSDGFLKRVEA